jgi:hypothetical protein
MMRMPRLFIFFCVSLISSVLPAQEYSILSYGAISGGEQYSTNAIQQAINAAGKQGGGRVIIPSGIFLSGAIYLQSGVELYLDKGAVLLGAAELDRYKKEGKVNALINANKATRISITGEGIIDGQSDKLIGDILLQLRKGNHTDASWKEINGQLIRRPSEWSRPKLVFFLGCDSVEVKGITLQNGSCWIQEYKDCRNLLIDGIKVESTTYWNNDGIDLTDCKDARVVNCVVNAADDAICLKSDDRNSRCENIYIADCRLRSSANAVKLGTASWGGFKNITIRNIDVYDTYRSAIAIESVDGGVIENIDVRNIRAVNTGNAFFIRLGHRNKDSVYSKVSGIHIADMRVEVPSGKPDKGYRTEGPLLKYPPGFKRIPGQVQSVSPWNHSWNDSTAVIYEHNVFPSAVAGLPGHQIENVLLENIEIIYAGGADSTINYFPVAEAEQLTNAVADYPEFSMFGEVPAWGIFIRHAHDIRMKNIRLVQQKPDYRTGLLLLQTEAVDIKKLDFTGPVTTPPLQVIRTGHRTLRKIRLNHKTVKLN